MWKKVYESSFPNLLVDPKPKIIISHAFTNRRIAIGLERQGWDWEQMAWLVPFMNVPGGRFDGRWYRLWQGKKMFTLPKEELKGCLLEIKPKNYLDYVTVRVYESFLADEFSI